MSSSRSLGVIMDPLHTIHPDKDTTLALLLEAQKRGFSLHYMEISDLSLQYGNAFAYTRPITLLASAFQTDSLTIPSPPHPNPLPLRGRGKGEGEWFTLGETQEKPLDQFDVLLMRKDPPVDMNYIYATYILEHAEQNGTLVLNKPSSLRDANEKLFTTWFPQCMPPTLVSSNADKLKAFLHEQGAVVFKTLDSLGGRGVFKCSSDDINVNVILEFLTHNNTRHIMAQQYLPEILTSGDKRILLIDGEPIPYALARMPQSGDFRGNISAGGFGVGVKLNARDRWICSQIGPILKEKGLVFVGIDVIGDYLTEINVTSPTCVRELEAAFKIPIASQLMDHIIENLHD